ncbi:MAG: glycogen synthase GlgA [Myxococcales bacterium]|nr:glycogen synthase GlgA [Myxococcales bacterium]
MRVLFLASEVAPFSKTGGLADVAGALPKALSKRGHELLVVTPLYSQVKDKAIQPAGGPFTLRFPFGEVEGWLRQAQLGRGHRVLFVDQPAFFQRPGLYQEDNRDYPDNHRRFAYFSIAALAAAELVKFTPEVVHLNDWQTGLAAVALARGYQGTRLSSARSVFTIHNLAYQGAFPKLVMDELGLPWELFNPEGLEFYDRPSFLKAGIAFADALTTVSRRYAEEIQTAEGGWGLEGFLRDRRHKLRGILNGADYSEWDPQADPYLPARFSPKDLSGKEQCKKKLLERFGLPAAAVASPAFGLVGRLADQKGIDLLLYSLPRLLERELTVTVLGSGEARYEQALRQLAARYPRKLGVKIGFDPALAHLLEAGSDFFLMPSRYEPCGLNQMYSLRYGAVPVVRRVGGLDDTVVDLKEKGATGIKFGDYQPTAFLEAVDRALGLYRDRRKLGEVRRRGMAEDFSWEAAAKQYEEIYQSLAAREGEKMAKPG